MCVCVYIYICSVCIVCSGKTYVEYVCIYVHIYIYICTHVWYACDKI